MTAPHHPRPFQQVDVFTATAYLGNPLAVVLDGSGLSSAQMQAFAHWTNLSETTFVLPPTPAGQAAGADYRVRIYTPGSELPFAGHPTLGTCHAWLAHGGQPTEAGVVRQECAVGVVELRQVAGRRAFAAPALRRSDPAPGHLAQVLAALGVSATQVLAAQVLNNGPEWLGLLLDSPDTALALTPDHAALERLGLKVGVAALTQPAPGSHAAGGADLLIARSSREARAFATPRAATTTAAAVTPGLPNTPGPAGTEPNARLRPPAPPTEPDLLVRAFAAPEGVNEDPVTGSLNASLAQWLMADGRLPATYTATQGQAVGRDGLVFLTRDAQGQVWVGGDAVTCVQGTVVL